MTDKLEGSAKAVHNWMKTKKKLPLIPEGFFSVRDANDSVYTGDDNDNRRNKKRRVAGKGKTNAQKHSRPSGGRGKKGGRTAATQKATRRSQEPSFISMSEEAQYDDLAVARHNQKLSLLVRELLPQDWVDEGLRYVASVGGGEWGDCEYKQTVPKKI